MNESPPKSSGIIRKRFSCGCEWDVKLKDGAIVAVDFEPEKAPLNCPKVWELLCSGRTKGVFQLETSLGQTTSKACQPATVEELSDVMSILRPGCGDAILDDKTLKQHYIDRKNGKDSPNPPHAALEDVLKDTYGIIVTQEQAMEASKVVAGFSGEQANKLRKAAGKKKPELMAQLRAEFLDGAKKTGRVTEEDAEVIFDIIEASQRYSFNKSHSISYALDALYFSAYAKSHFPSAFFLSELVFAKNIEEIGAVLDDALNFSVKICPPDLRLLNEEFLLENKCIRYGLGRIKGCGEAKIKKLIESLPTNPDTWRWSDIMKALNSTASDAAKAIICSGAVDFTLLTRSRMLFELNIFGRLNEKQQSFVLQYDSLMTGIQTIVDMGVVRGGPCISITSLKKVTTLLNEIMNPPQTLRDTPNQIFDWESFYLGYAFTTQEIDEGLSNCTCADFLAGKKLKEYLIAVTVIAVKPYLTKGKEPGQEMAFVDIKDSTGKISGVVFPKVWQEFRHKIFEGNKLMIFGSLGKKDSLLINKVMQL